MKGCTETEEYHQNVYIHYLIHWKEQASSNPQRIQLHRRQINWQKNLLEVWVRTINHLQRSSSHGSQPLYDSERIPPNTIIRRAPSSPKFDFFQDKIRSRAVNTTESTQQVIDNCLRDVTDQMVARLPNFKHVKRTIQRQRIVHDLPKIPHDKTFSTVSASLTTTIRGETFLQYDSGPGEHRILIFASSEQLDILSECEEVLIDGTFKVTPTIFTQLYTIHGVYRDAIFPLVFTLLSDKQQATYEKVINQLRLLRPSWNPKSVYGRLRKGGN